MVNIIVNFLEVYDKYVMYNLFIESYAPNLWLTILNRFQLKPSVFIRSYEKKLTKLLVDDYIPTRVSNFMYMLEIRSSNARDKI